MTRMFASPSPPTLTFQVVADDGQIVRARIDGQLAHRFQPAATNSLVPSRRTTHATTSEWQTAAPSAESDPEPNQPHHDEPLAAAIGEHAYGRRVLLNLSSVTGMETSGINWLLTLQKRMDADGGRLVLHSLSPAARSVVRVLKLDCALKVAADESDAVLRM
jgi:hypothetical protein